MLCLASKVATNELYEVKGQQWKSCSPA